GRPAVPRKVVAHDPVTRLGQPVDVVQFGERLRADAQEPDTEGPRHLAHLPHVRDERITARRRGVARQARKLQLAARLDRDPFAAALERDDVRALARRGEPARFHTGEGRLDPLPPAVRHRRAIQPDADLLLLDADPELRARLRASAKIVDQIVDGRRHGPRRLAMRSRRVNAASHTKPVGSLMPWNLSVSPHPAVYWRTLPPAFP